MGRVIYKKAAIKALEKMPQPMRQRFLVAFRRIASGEKEGLDIRKLEGRDGYRLRIGQYRGLYRIDENGECVVVVLKIKPRGDAYK